MRLFRPVGLRELLLIYDTEMTVFPPRLPEQPIFYPVLTARYASQIAREWNTTQGARVGYVTQFEIDDSYVRQFERRVVGSREHEELWILTEELPTFNQHIKGKIEIIEAFFGDGFKGYIPDRFGMKGKTALQQFVLVDAFRWYNAAMGFTLEIAANHKATFAHYPFWMQYDFSTLDIPNEQRFDVLRDVNRVWVDRFPGIKLCYAEYV